MKSNNFELIPIEVTDAEYILNLRLNPRISKFISYTDSSVEDQIKWLEQYKERERKKEEFYFKVVSKETKEKFGLVRIYHIDYSKKEATFGSFMMADNRPKTAAIETIIMMMELAFKKLKLEKVLLDVRIKNENAKNFYKRFGFKFLYKDNIDEYYYLNKEDYIDLFNKKYYKFLKEEKNK